MRFKSLNVFLSLLYLTTSVDAYNPVDHFGINCGSSGNLSSALDGRIWTGDINSNFLHEDQPSVATNSHTKYASENQAPYATARVSQSEFTYLFPVTPGQKFIRLFFYPSSYEGFDRSNAVFSVKSGGFTLLKDFNASLTADADQSGKIFREYSVNVNDGQMLDLTFTPSKAHPNSYSFINGIEILSMPTDLYYTKSDSHGLEFLGSTGRYSIGNGTALQTMYRLNVGGKPLCPKEDTGMFRFWENDEAYVNQDGALPCDYGDRSLKFDQIPNYTAPVEVYKTARSMGRNATVNLSYNLTWEFTVDSGFNYMLRLHFYESDPNMLQVGDRVFYIYIADHLAEFAADILRWTHEWEAPVYKDYAVFILGNERKANLTVKLHPHSEGTLYSDAILMGLEIFKVSDGEKNLAGPNPDPPPPSSTPPKSNSILQNPKKTKTNTKTIISIATGLVSGGVLLSIVAFFVVRSAKKSIDSKWASFPSPKSASTLPTHLCRYFSIAEIRAATKDFDDIFIIGTGGFGNVYIGYIDNGMTPVAIKRLKSRSQQGALEFRTEIEMLSQLRYLHLVSLIGYCNDGYEMILVYDFMARGTLREHLYKTDNQPLSWKHSLHICIGAAKGLQYLHTGAKDNIIHRDVKTTNILLDEKWVAKVSDFGLSKIGPSGISRSHITTMVKGSFGYLDPEYYMRQRLTQKSDVYAFGVVLLEVLCGRPPLLRTMEPPQAYLVDWARKCHSEGPIDELVDPYLKGTIGPECLKKYCEMAISCVLDDGAQRPSMNEIVRGLEFTLQLQESTEDATLGETHDDETCKESVLLTSKFIEDQCTCTE